MRQRARNSIEQGEASRYKRAVLVDERSALDEMCNPYPAGMSASLR